MKVQFIQFQFDNSIWNHILIFILRHSSGPKGVVSLELQAKWALAHGLLTIVSLLARSLCKLGIWQNCVESIKPSAKVHIGINWATTLKQSTPHNKMKVRHLVKCLQKKCSGKKMCLKLPQVPPCPWKSSDHHLAKETTNVFLKKITLLIF